jgi:DNA-binding PadR family transcriptional regulator
MILGVVSFLQPVHGYDVRRELLSWNAQDWANVQPGSIYHALRKMTDEGLLVEVATEQVSARPARTTYALTDKGAEEYQDLLRKFWWGYDHPIDPFMAGFAFVNALPAEEAAAALRNRARTLSGMAEGFRHNLASAWMRDTKPIHVAWMFELLIARAEAEVAWCIRIADRIEGGDLKIGSTSSNTQT